MAEVVVDKRLIDRDVRKGYRVSQPDAADLADLSDHLRAIDAEELERLGTELVQASESRRERIERQLAEEPLPKTAPRSPVAPLSATDI